MHRLDYSFGISRKKKTPLAPFSNREIAFSRLFFLPSVTLCSRILSIVHTFERRVRKTDGALRKLKVNCSRINLTGSWIFFWPCSLDKGTRRHLRQAPRLFRVLFQPLDRLHLAVMNNLSSSLRCPRTKFLRYPKYRPAIRRENRCVTDTSSDDVSLCKGNDINCFKIITNEWNAHTLC